MTVSAMIVTRDRCERLIQTLQQLTDQNPPPNEILVCADGCSDQTASRVATEFPNVRLFVNDCPLGSVGSRDQLVRAASGDWILSVDDDSHPMQADFFQSALHLIGSHPEAAVFTFPELRDEGQYSQPNKTPESIGRYVAAYANCAALMNRTFYLTQPGFPSFFHHMYEEPDFALQCYAGGKAVWFEPSLPFRHHRSSSGRQWIDRHHINARNELWSVWMRCPWLLLPFVTGFRVLRQFQSALRQSPAWVFREPQWWWVSLRGLPECLRRRKAVPSRVYLAWMKLSKMTLTMPHQFHSLSPQS